MIESPSRPFQLSAADARALGERGWLVHDRAFGIDVARAALADARSQRRSGRLDLAGLGRRRRRDHGRRGDLTRWIGKGDTSVPAGLRRVADLLDAVRREVREQAWLGLESLQVQLACYPGRGERYVRHRDAFHGRVAARRLTAIYYINEGWRPESGGCLRLHVAPEPVDLEPAADRLVLFLSERIEHEVLACHAERWAITAWCHGPRPLPGA